MEQTNTLSVFGLKNRTDGIMLQTTEIWKILLSLKTLAKQRQMKMTTFSSNNMISLLKQSAKRLPQNTLFLKIYLVVAISIGHIQL